MPEPALKKRKSSNSESRPLNHSPKEQGKGLRLILTEERVLEFKEQLEQIVKHGESEAKAVEILKSIETLKAINLEILKTTQIGWVVNDLRKTSHNQEVIRLSKDILKTWKKIVPENDEAKKRKNMSD